MRVLIVFFLLCVFSVNTLYGQQCQVVRGRVIEKNVESPVPYASVVLSGETNVFGINTDSLGHFCFHEIPVGRYDVTVKCLGYEPVLLREIAVGSSKEIVLDISLQESLLELKELVVKPKVNKAEMLNSMAIAGGRMLSVEEAGRYAGGLDDPARLVSSFAGVTATVGNNGIVVRGNAPKSLQWRIEDVEIPNPNHFADVTSFGGGGMTALSSNVLGNSDFFTGAFPSEYGNALSGVFDMKFRSGNNVNHEHAVQIGSLGIDVASEGPFKKGYDGSYIFNYRYSTLSLLSPLLPEDADGTDYQDLSFKMFLPTDRIGTFSIWGTGLIDRSGTKPEEYSSKWVYEQDMENQDVKQFMGAVGLNHKIRIDKSSFLKTTLAVTASGLDLHTERKTETAEMMKPIDKIKNTNWDLSFSSYYQRRYNEHHTNKTGVKIVRMNYDMFMQNNADGGMQLSTFVDETGHSDLFSAYSSSIFRLNEKWTINVGVNYQYFTLNGNYTIEPRVGVKFQIKPEHSISFAYGKHSRLEKMNYYFAKDNGEMVNKNMDFTKAHHLSMCYDLSLNGDKHLKIEPYIQYLYDVPVIESSTFSFINLNGGDDWYISERLRNEGEGVNYGLDVTFEKYMTDGFYYMLSGSVFNSLYRSSIGKWYDTRYNRNFVMNILAGKEWNVGRDKQNVFGVNGRLTFQGGDRYSPIDESASLERKEVVYDESKPFSKQFSPAMIGHITISYKINKKGLVHEFAAKLANVFGYKDYYGHRINFKENKVEPEREANIVPNISYKIEF